MSEIPEDIILNKYHHDKSVDRMLGWSDYLIWCDCPRCSCKDGVFCDGWGCDCCKDKKRND